MPRGQRNPLTITIEDHIRAAFPRHAVKEIGRGLDCSDRQAARIVATGHVPGAFRAALVALIDRALAHNREEIERLQAELRAIDYEAMVGRASARRQAEIGSRNTALSDVADGEPDATLNLPVRGRR